MINLTKLIDEDIFLNYLKNLHEKELFVYCKNYPKHYEGLKFNSMKSDTLKKVKHYLAVKFDLNESLSRIDQLKIRPEVTRDGNYQVFSFHFGNISPQIFIEKEASDYFREKNVKNLNLSSFCLEMLKDEINFKSTKLTDAEFEALIFRANKLEAKYCILFDRFLEFIEEYNLYYDYNTKEFQYTLK